jgi:dTDP-6-deoxy-L-talose 4-dehydrogenase (NAD+)
MKVLVSGATGFIGNHVVKALLSEGNQVIATSKEATKARRQSWFDQVDYIPLAIGQLPADLFSALGAPDCLVHLAWQGLPNYDDLYHIEANLFENYCFVKKLVENGLKHIAVAGTCLEYGMQSGALDEEMLPDPTTPYGVAKNSLRVFLEQLQRKFPFRLDWIRLFYTYGKGQRADSILSLLDAALDRNDTVFNMSGGEQLRDYLPVSDVARILVRIISQSQVSGIINCCSGRPISIRRLVEAHLAKKEKTIRLNLGHYPYPEYEPMAFWGDTTKLSRIV